MGVARVMRLSLLGLLLTGALGALALQGQRVTGQNPLAESALSPAERYRFEGVVGERLVAGSYTYLQILPARGPATWVVTLGRGLPTRAKVSVLVVGRARDFKSARLARTFSQLLFGVVRSTEAKASIESTMGSEHSTKEQNHDDD